MSLIGTVFLQASEKDLINIVSNDGKFSLYLAVIDELNWNYPGKVAYFSSKSWAFINNDENEEKLLQRMLTAITDVLLDTGHLSTIMKRDLKKRMDPHEIAALSPNHQVV